MHAKALKFLAKLFLVCLLMLPFAGSAEARGRIFIAPGYGFYYPYGGLGFGWGWGWGWGYPYGWPYAYYGPYEARGQLKIKDSVKSDEVYINGAYAGTVDKLKNMKLNPGRYSVRISQRGKELLSQNVYIVAGKTVEIDVGRP